MRQLLEGRSCEELCERWQITPELAVRLLELDARWRDRFPNLGGLYVISGYRTAEEQRELEREGRPAAPDELSTHRSCPATGADLQLPLAYDDGVALELGNLALLSGLRWGGGSPVNHHGIPIDWNHVDLGPRARA